MAEEEEDGRVGGLGLGTGTCSRQSEERLYESPGVGGCGCDFGRIQAGQDFEAVPAFVIAASGGGPSSPFKAAFDIPLRDLFDLPGIPWQRLRPESLLVEGRKRLAIRKETRIP